MKISNIKLCLGAIKHLEHKYKMARTRPCPEENTTNKSNSLVLVKITKHELHLGIKSKQYEPKEQNKQTIIAKVHNFLRTSIMSCNRMMLGWSIFFNITISDKRLSQSLLLNFSMAISLMATSVPRTRCRPCHTTEYDPDPICRPTTYSPITQPPPTADIGAAGTLAVEKDVAAGESRKLRGKLAQNTGFKTQWWWAPLTLESLLAKLWRAPVPLMWAPVRSLVGLVRTLLYTV